MAIVKELMRLEDNGTLSFGDYTLPEKKKLADFEYQGDLMKVKTFSEMTKLEKNGLLVYESVPGTTVEHMELSPEGMCFTVSGKEDVQITLGLEEDAEYRILLDHEDIGTMKTIMGGKLAFSVELEETLPTQVTITKL